VPLVVPDVIQGFPTIKLYRMSPTGSVHYSGDRDATTFIRFLERHATSDGEASDGGTEEGASPAHDEM